MAINLSTDLVSAIAAATGVLFDGGTLKIFTGSPPGPDAAETGTLIVTLNVPTPAFAEGNIGEVVNPADWIGIVEAADIPGYFRLASANGVHIREGTAGDASAPAGEDMLISGLTAGATTLGAALRVEAGSYSLTVPQA